MIHRRGEESPEHDESTLIVPSDHSLAVASVSPTSALASGSGELALAEEVSTGSTALRAAICHQPFCVRDDVDHELAPFVEECRLDGETFEERLARLGKEDVSEDARRGLYS